MLTGFVAVVLTFQALVIGSPAAQAVSDPPADGCSTQSDPVPAKSSGRPVIYVHGWLSSAKDSEDAVRILRANLGSGFEVFTFDYQELHSMWPVGSWVQECLAEYVQAVVSGFHQAGGEGGAIGVGHSMGGVALRAASAVLDKGGRSDLLAGIVTLGTPHQGTPWGGTLYAEFYDEVHRFGTAFATNFRIVPAGTDAVKCLATGNPPGCQMLGYLPEKTMIATVGSQVIVQRKLFDVPYIEESTADIPLFGDVIVPRLSANGYPLSSTGKITGDFMGEMTVSCVDSSSYLSQNLARILRPLGVPAAIIGTELAAIAQIWNDSAALDGLIAGEANINQIPLMMLGMQSSCFHTSLPNAADSQNHVANFVLAMDAKLPHGSRWTPPGQRIWLYDVPSTGDAGSGSQTGERLGTAPDWFRNSTTQWVGCGGSPAVRTYDVSAGYTLLSATVGQRLGTPKSLSAEYVIHGDGEELARFALSDREVHEVKIDLTGIRALSLSAQSTGASCLATSSSAFGVLGDAILVRTAIASGAGPEGVGSTPAATNGWPVWRQVCVINYL